MPFIQHFLLTGPSRHEGLCDKFGGWSSIAPVWHQIQEMGEDLMKILAVHPDSINLMDT